MSIALYHHKPIHTPKHNHPHPIPLPFTPPPPFPLLSHFISAHYWFLEGNWFSLPFPSYAFSRVHFLKHSPKWTLRWLLSLMGNIHSLIDLFLSSIVTRQLSQALRVRESDQMILNQVELWIKHLFSHKKIVFRNVQNWIDLVLI